MFHRDVTFDHRRPTAGYTLKNDVANIFECARMCTKLSQCTSFFYADSDLECQLHGEFLDAQTYNGSLESQHGSKYYTIKTNDTVGRSKFCIVMRRFPIHKSFE